MLGNSQDASVFAGSDCVELKGPEIIAELKSLLKLLKLCRSFSEKPFQVQVFLESTGYSLHDVLVLIPKARFLKPAFTIIRDRNSKCLLLLIRGTHSFKDALTAATAVAVPFHPSVLHEGGISKVLGHAHYGMVSAAHWIAELSTPRLLKALGENPDYKVKIFGHSLGGGTAALLTYILREKKEFSSCTCFTFGPAACMTSDLAESGKHFITTLINGSDLVPTLSAASVDNLLSEVDLRGKRVRIRRWVRKVVSSVLSYKKSVRNKEDNSSSGDGSEDDVSVDEDEEDNSSSGDGSEDDDDDKRLMSVYGDIASSSTEGITEGGLWSKLEKELKRLENEINVQAQEEKAAAASMSISLSDVAESHHFYPPGRIMHIVSIPASSDMPSNERVGIFETPRKLYSKIRPSRRMFKDHSTRMYEEKIEYLIKELEKP